MRACENLELVRLVDPSAIKKPQKPKEQRPKPVVPRRPPKDEEFGHVVIPTDKQHNPMTIEEQKKLQKNIKEGLNQEQQQGIVEIVKKVIQQGQNNKIEFELGKLPIEVQRELEQYVNKCITMNQKREKRKIADRKRRVDKQMKQRLAQNQTPMMGQPQQPMNQQMMGMTSA